MYANLNGTAQLMLAGILITLCIWIFKPFRLPYAAGGFFLALFGLAAGLPPAIVFSGFTQPAVWTLIPALFFGYTLQKTGLGKRIALTVIRLCRPSYISLVLAWVLIGVILSILTPSITVRVAIVIPIAVQFCELCKIQKGAKGSALILLTAFGMAIIPGSGWMSGLLAGPIMQGMYNATPGLQGIITFNSWFSVMFIPMMTVTALTAAGSLIFLKPDEPISREVFSAIKEQPTDKITLHEIITVLMLLIVFLMFLTSSHHKIPDAAVCLAAVFLFFVFGILEARDFNTGVNWDLVVFMGMALSLGAVFSETGISQWLSAIVVPALAPIAVSPWIFIPGIMALMFAWRFVDVAIFIPTMAIMIPILPDIQQAYGINPLIWAPVFVMAHNCFFMAYQNIWAMMSRTMAGDRAWDSRQLGIYGVIYFIACLLALIPFIPVWINAGFF